jgi:hypothetical protein
VKAGTAVVIDDDALSQRILRENKSFISGESVGSPLMFLQMTFDISFREWSLGQI